MRRGIWSGLAAVAAVASALGGLSPAGAGGRGETTFTVRKVVSGPATEGTTVQIVCGEGESAETANLGFDATGAPTTSDVSSFVIEGGAWVLHTTQPPSDTTCTFTETQAGGAASTSWTCAYESQVLPDEAGATLVSDPPSVTIGCGATSGTGTGPVSVGFAGLDGTPRNQRVEVVFTNTYAAPVVVVTPSFTG